MNHSQHMDALTWLGPRSMEMRSTQIPTLKDGEVLIRVSAAGICGSELSGYLGENSLRVPPLVMGHEASGQIVQVTAGNLHDGSQAREDVRVTFNPLVTCGICDRCRAGRSNLCRTRQIVGIHRPGAFAEYVAVPANLCYPLAATMSTSVAALTEPLACSVRAVSLSHVQPDQSLLILGAGPIGLFCLAAAKAQGIQNIVISDMSASRLEIARRWGAQATIQVGEQDLITTIQRLFPGGVDTVIDAVGLNATRAQAVQAVVPGGQVVFIGLHHESSPLEANYLVRQEVTISGSFSYTPTDFDHAFAYLEQGLLQADTDWLEERPLTAGPGAFAELVDGMVAATKIVLRVG
ncbi:galactitol-1-phosphate 5-dehydrogenase [Dictyobacter alpinus]|uniref:Galactitol-1-phosphate 5-dehydrogenase n=1 Tax=Dictyobacter alpinus TaxID=2014873 RepID=A0A402BI29_9CHLR|nr:alcohol dehydrogenase catalytic domain-containing protein [Dictyobacter alpinus]GCE31015.1 galactitol-1-phosphate 5-dehydrogenase [Dictyobacter alpinus]